MKIQQPTFTTTNGIFRYNTEVESGGAKKDLWYELDNSYKEYFTNTLDGPLVALLLPSMTRGENIQLNGKVSEKLYYNITYALQYILKSLFPSLKIIKISAKKLIKESTRASSTASGFSGGIDSFYTLSQHNFNSSMPENYKIKNLMYYNVGAFAEGKERLFREKYRRLLPIAKELNLPFIAVNSNMDDFYGKNTFIQSHTLRTISVGLTLQNGFDKYLFASGYSYIDTRVSPSKTQSISLAEPLIVPLLSTERFDPSLVGSEVSRVEKTNKTAILPYTKKYLDVCIDTNFTGNCSRCRKCIRTMLTLYVLGKLDEFSEVFNTSVFKKNMFFYLAQLYRDRKEKYPSEIISYGKQLHFKIPLLAKVYAGSRMMGLVNRLKEK
jgi:hypothetical protein